MELLYKVENENTVRQVLRERFGMSNRLIAKLKKNKQIFFNGSNIFLDKAISANDEIRIDLDFEEDNSNIVPTKIKLDVLYEDEGFLIVNKPPFLPVHPSLNHYEDSLSNGIKYYYDEINLKRKIRPINRLDKDTSGIVIFAKNDYMQDRIKIIKKEYYALVSHKLDNSGIIDKPIARKDNSIIERCTNENGEKAITEYEQINYLEKSDVSLVKCILHTGRTHQIRVHMKYIGHPILGDTLYGASSKLINRQALHNYKVEFIHPITHKKIEIVSPIPNDMLNIINE